MNTAYYIIVWICVSVNIGFLIVNIRLMVCRWLDVREEAIKLGLKAALINEREGRKELQRAEALIKKEWDDV